MCSCLGRVASRQASSLRLLWATPAFRAPLITIWVASFGGALHAPVTTGFLRKVGATAADIGTIGAVMCSGTVLLSPFYGWVLDRYGGLAPMVITCFFCAAGCAVRGFATNVRWLFIGSGIASLGAGNLWTVTLTFLSTNTARQQRSDVVSAFLFQVATLRLVGKLLYAPFDVAMATGGCQDDLLRDRVAMSVCTFFCIFGVFLLLLWRPANPRCAADDAEGVDAEGVDAEGVDAEGVDAEGVDAEGVDAEGVDAEGVDAEGVDAEGVDAEGVDAEGVDAEGVDAESASSRVGCPSGARARDGNGRDTVPSAASPAPQTPQAGSSSLRSWPFAALVIALFLQAAALTSVHTLWPIALQDHLGIGSRGYGVLLFTASLLATGAVGAAPGFERSVGGAKAAAALLLIPAAAVPVAFGLLPRRAGHLDGDLATALPGLTLGLHTSLAVIAIVCLTAVEPMLKSLASLRAPTALQGRSFGALAVGQSLGMVFGNIASTRMYALGTSGRAAVRAGTIGGAEGGGQILSAVRGDALLLQLERWTHSGLLPFVAVAALLLAAVALVRATAAHDAAKASQRDGVQDADAEGGACRHRKELLSLLPKTLDNKGA